MCVRVCVCVCVCVCAGAGVRCGGRARERALEREVGARERALFCMRVCSVLCMHAHVCVRLCGCCARTHTRSIHTHATLLNNN